MRLKLINSCVIIVKAVAEMLYGKVFKNRNKHYE
jgi:hypothetical protein